MKHSEFEWETKDGLRLYAQSWQPDTEPRAIICLVHGLGDHSGRFVHLGAFLCQEGYALLAFDLRGNGKSEGQRGHAKTFQTLLDDIAQFLDESAKRFPSSSRFLYGHSFGGGLVLNYVLRRRPQLAGVIVTAPSLRTAFEPPAWKMTLAKIMCLFWPSIPLYNELDLQGLSQDKEIIRAYEMDPLVHDRITARMGIDLLQTGLWALEHAAEFPLPLLLMHGAADRFTSAQASRAFASSAGDGCTLKIWEGLYHEIHNEPEKEKVFAYLLEWLESKRVNK